MKFTAELRQLVDPLWQASFVHPFVREIAEGTLDINRFIHYLKQDSYYLTNFAKAQSLAAAGAPTLEMAGRLAFHAQSTSSAEHALHEAFFNDLGIVPDRSFVPAPTAYKYVTHLLSVASFGTVGEIIAAILPCYWLYWEIGKIYAHAKPNHPIYDKWIATYGDEWFGNLVQEQIDRLDELAEAASEAERNRMIQHFVISSHYELQFWQMAYTLEGWD
ncbi:MAG: transcriptional activator, TenA family [Bacilli bacterium]|nr:transcriptional activator, TenA family [Bacilli bacterium]